MARSLQLYQEHGVRHSDMLRVQSEELERYASDPRNNFAIFWLRPTYEALDPRLDARCVIKV